MDSPISIGCDCGGPEAKAFCELKISLFHSLSKYVASTHCSEIDEYALVLRVDGQYAKFGPEGVYRVRLSKSKRYISADIQIPQEIWQPMNEYQMKMYLAQQIKSAVLKCVSRLQKEKYQVEEDKLKNQIESSISNYLNLK
jgi:hypothetical protein